jgi:sec-independent protein translocase protein TatA
MGALQPMHLIVVLVIILLIFGPGKLPELGKAIGDGMRELKKATNGDAHTAANVAPAATATAPVTAEVVACTTCARSNRAGQPFCGYCGGRLTQAA